MANIAIQLASYTSVHGVTPTAPYLVISGYTGNTGALDQVTCNIYNSAAAYNGNLQPLGAETFTAVPIPAGNLIDGLYAWIEDQPGFGGTIITD